MLQKRQSTARAKVFTVGDLSSELAFQESMLPLVSRTFALTIPQLPEPLDRVVANAYLWCRIADTIEDEPVLDGAMKRSLHQSLIAVIDGTLDAGSWAQCALGHLTDATVTAERDLVAQTDTVARITRSFDRAQIDAIRTCVTKMCSGMTNFEFTDSNRGLETTDDLDCYCYYVAGVVGEMLTTLFCYHSSEIAEREAEMAQLAASFGQGLQMTNILKDIWEDLEEGRCWLPREVFARVGYNLNELAPSGDRESFNVALVELVATAHGHLRNALNYTLLIPTNERGIRRFCLWSLGLAVLTLQHIARRPGFKSAEDVKVSRLAVGATIASTNLFVHHNLPVRIMFELAANRLPLKPVPIGYTSNLHDMVPA